MIVEGVQASICRMLRHWSDEHQDNSLEVLVQKANSLLDLKGNKIHREQLANTVKRAP